MMDIISLLIANLIPLYVLVALGFITGRWLGVNLPSISAIAIYILGPVTTFGAIAQMEFSPEYIILPIIFFFGSAIIAITAYQASKKVWKNDVANLIGMTSVTGNTIYFGMPVVVALIGYEWLGLYSFINLGIFINVAGLGYFLGARGNATVRGAIIKVLKLPVLHSIWLGFLYNFSGLPLHKTFIQYWEYTIGTSIIIGMMIIGVALSKQTKLEFETKLLISLFIPKFILWPIFSAAVIALDYFYFHAFSKEIYLMIALIGAVPLAGNTAAYAATLNLHPERAAAAILISTILGIITVPLAVVFIQFLS